MRLRSRTGDLGLLARHLRSSVASSVLVAILVFAAVLATALAPRALVALGDQELHATLAAASPSLRDLSGTGRLGVAETAQSQIGSLLERTNTTLLGLPDRVPEPLRSALGETRWAARTPADDVFPPDPQPLRTVVSLTADLRRDEAVAFTAGGAPAPWDPPPASEQEAGAAVPPIEIAVSQALAERLGLVVGDQLEYRTAPLLVTGVYAARNLDDRYWVYLPDLVVPTVSRSGNELPTLRASVYVDPQSIAALPGDFASGRITVWVPVDPTRLRFADIGQLQPQAREVIATSVGLPNFGDLDLRTGLADAIDKVVARVSAVSALLALVGSGLFGVLVAVLALGVRAVQQRRAPALALAQARGASPLRVRTVMTLEGLLVAVPAGALAGVVAAVAVPADPGPAGVLLPTAATLTVPVLFAVLTPTRPMLRDRGDLRVGARSSVRWVVEAAVLGLAAVSLFLLARRGLVGTSAVVGIDPLLAAMPILLAAAVCVVVLRVYPAPMLAVQAAARRGRSATALVGAARAVREPALGFPAVLALVVGVAVIVASGTLAATVRGALERTAEEAVGADLRVEAAALPDEVVDGIRDTGGVAAAAGVAIADGVQFEDGAGYDELFLVVADTAALHEVRADLPALPSAADSVRVAASDDWSGEIVGTNLRLAGAPATLAGVLPVDALPGVTRTWALVDESALGRLDIDTPIVRQVLVRLAPGADADAVARGLSELVAAAQPTETARDAVTVSSARAELAAATAAPSVGALERFLLLLAAGAALLLTVLAVLLASITGAAARGRLVAVLRVLGLSRRQVRRLLAWELAPGTVTATVVGTGLGLALPVIIAAALDLRPFVGGRIQPGVAVDPLGVAAGVGAFLVTVILAGVVAAALSRRIAPAGALKMGDA